MLLHEYAMLIWFKCSTQQRVDQERGQYDWLRQICCFSIYMIQYSHCPVLPSLVSNYIFYFSSPGTKYRGTSRFKSSAISYNLEVGPSKKVKVTQSGMMTRMTLTLVREYKRLNLESLLTCFYFYFLWGGLVCCNTFPEKKMLHWQLQTLLCHHALSKKS